jgi:hypothetical protein
MPNHEEFDDEEDENEVANNFLTQAELFRSYTEQNDLFINISNVAFWFEYGGRKIGSMNIDPINLEKFKKHRQGQVREYDECSEP